MVQENIVIMFLASNYTSEAFFWIILIAIAIVTLTIFFATPKPASKKPQDWKVSHLKGTIDGVSSAKPTGIQKEIQDTSSDNIEKKTDPEIIEIKKPINYREMAFAIFGVILIIGSVSILQSTFNLFNIQEECELVPYSKCSGVNFSGQDLSGIDLTGIDLSYANLTGANLIHADLTGADLNYAELSDAYLRFADLTSADLQYADFTDADLRFADLTGADLQYADFTDAIVTDADFTDTYWYQTIWTDGVAYDGNQA